MQILTNTHESQKHVLVPKSAEEIKDACLGKDNDTREELDRAFRFFWGKYKQIKCRGSG